MKSVSFFGIAVITTIAVAEAERPLPLEVRMLACVIAGMLGGVLNSWRRHGRVALDGGTAGFIGGLIGAASNYWAQETLTAGLWAIVAAGLVGYSGPGTYDKLRQFGPAILERIFGVRHDGTK